MSIEEENKRGLARIFEYDKLKAKTNRTKEEQERYEYLKKTYFKPLTREKEEIYKRYIEEAKGMDPKFYNT